MVVHVIVSSWLVEKSFPLSWVKWAELGIGVYPLSFWDWEQRLPDYVYSFARLETNPFWILLSLLTSYWDTVATLFNFFNCSLFYYYCSFLHPNQEVYGSLGKLSLSSFSFLWRLRKFCFYCYGLNLLV